MKENTMMYINIMGSINYVTGYGMLGIKQFSDVASK